MILAITGHRPSRSTFPATDRALWHLENLARKHLKLIEPDRVLIGMALGWDTACGLVCQQLGIPFVAVLPFVGQENRWEAYDQIRFRNLLRNADEILCLHSVPVVSHVEAAKLYHQRNRYLVDHADRVLALLNPKVQTGGTYATVSYAIAKNLPVTNTWAEMLLHPVRGPAHKPRKWKPWWSMNAARGAQ